MWTVFLIFIIEIVVFTIYNFYNDSYSYAHWLLKFSLIFAIVYLAIIFLMWVYIMIVPMKDDS